ncbi:hypothetical protein F5B22DRAFT_647470 [Xylaria bambusicola]|uniref:uncharacterized protein n=1 Tax=Xylaria bambusicola TaxID=326684 RepID=UPI002007599C|nr:uncharacterized protein F5B22DRAFT_647470 [Xylaria bambusicola]KAI0514714.1 hypothetical protein F5B22DRAFT_647470 [Xylaria bambusicola]
MMFKKVSFTICSCLLMAQSAFGSISRPKPQYGNLVTSLIGSINWGPSTQWSFPGQRAFSNATERWTTFSEPTYLAAVSPGTEQDLAKLLRAVTTLKIPFLVTSGRHGFNPTLGGLQNGLAIDLSRFNKLEIDTRKDTLTIGPAIRTADLLDPVYNAGYEIQGGTCTCPSFIGVTLGGGIGRWEGVYGLFIDALQSVRFVAANGTILTASKTKNSELFWGIKGAGANLGVVIEATYKLHKIDKRPTPGGSGYGLNADFIIPAEKNASYWKLIESLMPYPSQLAIVSVVGWNSTINATQIVSNWEYFGAATEAEARAVLAPILALEPSVSSIQYLKWPKLFYAQQFGSNDANCIPDRKRDIYTASIRHIDPPTWEAQFAKMAAFFEKYPSARATSAFAAETYPTQATLAVPDDDAAYPWRDAQGYLVLQFGWDDDSTDGAAAAAASLGPELRTAFAATSGYEHEIKGGLAVYVNYAHGEEPIESIYRADKLPRLAALKKTWDPNNVFAYHLALPREYRAKS